MKENIDLKNGITIKGELSTAIKREIGLVKANCQLERIRKTARGREHLKNKKKRSLMINKIAKECKNRELANDYWDKEMIIDSIRKKQNLLYTITEVCNQWDGCSEDIKNSGYIDMGAVREYIKREFPNDWNDKLARQLKIRSEFNNLKLIRNDWVLS
jgi:hypothetical protein